MVPGLREKRELERGGGAEGVCSRGQARDVYQSLHQTPAVLHTLSGEVSLIYVIITRELTLLGKAVLAWWKVVMRE